MKPGKQTRQLPTRGGLNDLGKSGRTIMDYGKAITPTEKTPTVMQALELFVMAMREYATLSAEEMIRCAPELLMRAQGMAIASNEISHAVQYAPQLHEKNQEARHARPTQRSSFGTA